MICYVVRSLILVVVTFSVIVKKTRWNVKKRNVKVSKAILSTCQFRNSCIVVVNEKLPKGIATPTYM